MPRIFNLQNQASRKTTMPAMFKTIAVLGPGLLGASLMQAVRAARLAEDLAAWAPSERTRRKCAGQPWCDRVCGTPAECARGAELVVVCAPADKIAPALATAAPGIAADALVTDVGSIKTAVCEAVWRDDPRRRTGDGAAPFVGSHPMAGGERSGMENASADMFAGRTCFVTPVPETPPAATARVEAFWSALGMRVRRLSPEEHDAVVAATSHLVHFTAAALAGALAGKPEAWRELGGPGLRDTTRVAAGDPALWTAIARGNRIALLGALDEFHGVFDALVRALREQDYVRLGELLARARVWREAL